MRLAATPVNLESASWPTEVEGEFESTSFGLLDEPQHPIESRAEACPLRRWLNPQCMCSECRADKELN